MSKQPLTPPPEHGHAEATATKLQLLGLLSADVVRTYCDDATGAV
jgi:hypothetical protein